MANGFVTARPTERHGDTHFLPDALDRCSGFKFTTPGSGRLNIGEIGVWGMTTAAGSGTLKFAIFSHNDGDDSPQEYSAGGLVANSESSEYLLENEDWAITKHEYTNAPLVYAGVPYWLCIHTYDVTPFDDLRISQYGSGGRRAYNPQPQAEGWPSDWVDSSFSDRDVGAYAIYSQGLPTYMEAMHQVSMGFNELNGGMQ